jgi:hypothetical protein
MPAEPPDRRDFALPGAYPPRISLCRNMTGAYRVRHLTIHNRVVLTNKTPIKTTGDGYMVAEGR